MTDDAGTAASSPVPPAIVLVRPQEEGNVGAVARAMANFGLARLILVEPATPLRATARAYAVHAGGILESVERHPDLAAALAGFSRVVATTAARDRPWPQRLIAPRELPPLLAADPPATRTAIVFGPEPSGLTNRELALAGALVRVPTAPEQPTLNLAQAVLIVAYELHFARVARIGCVDDRASSDDPLATAEELGGLFDHLAQLLGRARFARDTTISGVERDLRQMLSRALPTRREVSILRGVLRRFSHALESSKGRASGSRRRPG